MLASLPLEIIEEILLNLDPLDVAHLSECCNLLRSLVYDTKDQALWRGLYLQQPLDDPRKCVSQEGVPNDEEINWKEALQRFVRARTVLYNTAFLPRDLTALRVLLDLATHVPPLSSPEDVDNLSRNVAWVAATLGRVDDFHVLLDDEHPASEEEIQLRARVHTYYGLRGSDLRRTARVRSRAYVYDMRNYRADNHYGPLDSRGHVNWVHVQALHHVVSMHLVDLKEHEMFDFAIFPMSIFFIQPVISPGMDLDQEEDWAGVAGPWRVSFCFCDHRELLKYNESDVDENGNLDTSVFESPDFGEVFRSMNVMLRVIGTRPDPDHPKRPIIDFAGAMLDNTSTMRGEVRMTPDNQVQWHFVSGDQDSAVWSSLGIQVGGVRAQFGVLGSWTTVFHESDDPVGPFWLRRQGEVTLGLPVHHVLLNASQQ
ncbi:putative F-box domain-containing protein [Lyophyllum shimeji]|uniref:F-box domain-containing protein n=1 Tax=Lyophyllum shimeji TaxID=47721 RepID=A0A9P3PLS5_LYOSH|nr:putative F-box domain-containing protein [Lyophyllum shimeji]